MEPEDEDSGFLFKEEGYVIASENCEYSPGYNVLNNDSPRCSFRPKSE